MAKAMLLAGALAILAASVDARAEDSGAQDSARRLAVDRGCYTCHSDKRVQPSAKTVLPLAPSWSEIASRYRKQADAETRLAGIVITGSDPRVRHWPNEAAFASMLPNDAEVTPEQARTLVHWIIASPH